MRRIVVLHLAVRYPFAGVIWQLLHHLIGFRNLGYDVYYVEDHGSWAYDPLRQAPVADPTHNVTVLAGVMARFGFGDRWAFYDSVRGDYLGMSGERCYQLLAEADAVINLCGASRPREEHQRCRCLVYLQTDPGKVQLELTQGIPQARELLATHKFFFSYALNIGQPDCRLPTGSVTWHPTTPPVLLNEWQPRTAPAAPAAFTTVGTWQNKGGDVEFGGESYFWSKDVNFRKFLDVARRAGQPIELATDLDRGPDYEHALAGGFTFRPVVPLSLDLDTYRDYISSSRGEFTAAKDLYVRTCSGWFSDRTVCYLAAGRPAVTQRTGFEKYIPEGVGLLGFDSAEEAAAAVRTINSDYARHCRAAREIAAEYFDANKLLKRLIDVIGI
jgi:hypothetical protein